MNIRKILVICIVLCASVFGVFAMSADDIIEKAIQNSVAIKTLELNRENSIISRKINDVEDGVSVGINYGEVTFQKEKTGSPFFEYRINNLNVGIPIEKDSTLSFGVSNTSSFYLDGKTNSSLTPSVDYAKEFSLDSFNDSRTDVTKKMAQIREDLSYQRSLLQFRTTVLQDILSILESELTITEQDVAYKRLVADYDTAIASGDITKEGLKDLQARMEIENARVTLENSKTKLENALKQFKNNYGFDFEAPDPVRSASLSFEENKGGNTAVLLAELSLNLANQEVEIASGTSNKLVLGAHSSIPVYFSNESSADIGTINSYLSGTLKGSNYSVKAEAGLDYLEKEFWPYLTISGTWQNKTKAEVDDLNLQTLKNKVILAQIDYDDAVSEYKNGCASLRTSISDYITKLEQFEVSADYDLKILERVKEMYALGLVTERKLEDAQNVVNADEIKRTTLAINALIIENNIAINQL